MGKVGGKGEVSTQLLTRLANFLAAGTYGDETTGVRVIITDESGSYLTSLGGGGAGGGSIIYSNAAGDFNITANPGTETLTVSGLPFTLEAINIIGGSIEKIDASDDVSSLDLGNVSVTGVTGGSIISLSQESNFATGDNVYAMFVGPDKGYDRSQDLDKVNVYNQPQYHYTDPENWSLTDVTGLQRTIISMDTYKYWNFQYSYSQTGSQTGTMKVYYSNVASADTSSLTNWIDSSTGVLGAGSIEMAGTGTTEGFKEVGPTSPIKYMLEIDITAAGTGIDVASDVYIRKFY